jgi:hypothetical protein
MVHHRREDCSVSLLEPNRSVEATSHGGAAWPGNGYFVYSPFPGQAAPPRAAPHLERYAPGSDAWAQMEPHAQHIVFDRL